MPPTALVLDYDGVICHSMERHAQAYRATLAPLGVVVQDQDVFAREGARSETILRELMVEAGLEPGAKQVRQLARDKQTHFEGNGGPPDLYVGAAHAVRLLAGQLPLGLVTGTRRTNLEARIPDLLPLFSAVMAQEDYGHDKPHPEPYQRAARALGAKPSRVAVIENATRGIQSARAAGYGLILAVATTMPAGELIAAGADEVEADLAAWGRRLPSQQP